MHYVSHHKTGTKFLQGCTQYPKLDCFNRESLVISLGSPETESLLEDELLFRESTTPRTMATTTAMAHGGAKAVEASSDPKRAIAYPNLQENLRCKASQVPRSYRVNPVDYSTRWH